MSTPEQIHAALSIPLILGCNLGLLTISSLMYFRTRRVGFILLATGFALFLMEPIILWSYSPQFSDSASSLDAFVKAASVLHPLGLVLLLSGFHKLFLSKTSRYD